MKMCITEKQLARILSHNEEIDEAASLTSPSTTNQTTSSSTTNQTTSPSTSTSSSGGENSGGVINTPERPDGVPEMNKWPSQNQGPARGNANPAGTVKPWESGITRGPSNQLT